MKLKHLLTLGVLALCSGPLWAQAESPSPIAVAANQGTPLPFDNATKEGGNFFDTHEGSAIAGTITYSLDVQEEGDYYLYISSGNKGGINHQFTVKVNEAEGIVYGPYDNLGGNWNTYVMDVKKIKLPQGSVTLQISVNEDATRWYLGQDYPPYLIPSEHTYMLGETSVQIDPLHVWPKSTLNFTSVCFGGNDGTKRKPFMGNNEASLLASDKCPSNDQNNYSFYPKSKLYYPVNLTKGGLYPIEIKGTFYTVNKADTDGYTIVVSDENENKLGEINNFTNGTATGTLKIDSSNIKYLVFTAEGSSSVIYMMSGISIDKPSNLLLTLNDIEGNIYENAKFTVTGTYVADETPTIKIYVDEEEKGNAEADNGTFSYTFENGLEKGEYTIKAKASLDDGTESSTEIPLTVYANDHTFYITIEGAENGSVSATVDGSTVEADASVYPVEIGKDITFTFTPDQGYEFNSASSKDFDLNPEISEGVGTVTVSNVQNNGTINVVFDEEKITIAGNIQGNGFLELHYAEGSNDKLIGEIKNSETTYKVEKGKDIRIYFKANTNYKSVNIAKIIMTQGEKETDITDLAWRNMNWQQPIYLIESISENTTFDVYFERVVNDKGVEDKEGFANEFVTINVPEESAEYGTVTVKRWSATSDSESEIMTLAVNGNGTVDLPGYITENTELAITVTPNQGCTISKFEIEHGDVITPVIENNSVAITHKLTVSESTLTVTADFEKTYVANGYYLANSMTAEYGGAFNPNPSYRFQAPETTESDDEDTDDYYTLYVGSMTEDDTFYILEVTDGEVTNTFSFTADNSDDSELENNNDNGTGGYTLTAGETTELKLDGNYLNITFYLLPQEGGKSVALYFSGTEDTENHWNVTVGNDQTNQSGTVTSTSEEGVDGVITLNTLNNSAVIFVYAPSSVDAVYYAIVYDEQTSDAPSATAEVPADLNYTKASKTQNSEENVYFIPVEFQSDPNKATGTLYLASKTVSDDSSDSDEYTNAAVYNITLLRQTPTGIEIIDTDNEEIEYYDLNGIRVNSDRLHKGIYIVKKGVSTFKVVIP